MWNEQADVTKSAARIITFTIKSGIAPFYVFVSGLHAPIFGLKTNNPQLPVTLYRSQLMFPKIAQRYTPKGGAG